ncbi:septal ring lytic transglycosylase RlpA family protein [Pontibacter diazotrophicus]|uniref:Probable endolytic peptidoglycan transglycosylase RlpA n=1 Tax=Pontibacter diazotrophicus TaxID=1400979 RepID=A0A3D8LGS7_9BACT|nr:septal ring lytic transglycosylase RlpA family protein [Pontibacter diazotrophicus]RDV16659.1 septal ring lytic transglycosylase RlpA family protein [Pontibacter diazotrophicus]
MNFCSIVFLFILSLQNSTASYTAEGKASYYADRLHGHRTASGERYDKEKFTAAHATLPFNTLVRVTNLKNGKAVVVTVNDRMARSRHNIIDVSRAAALQIGLIREGSALVRLDEVKKDAAEQQELLPDVSEAEATPKN